jgi:acetyltransferase-like isoleucine patch superfamily enzyme
MIGFVRSRLRKLALEQGRFVDLCVRYGGALSPEDNARLWLRRGLHSIGRDVGIVSGTTILDPAYVRIGNNVLLANCTLIGHDGSIEVLNRAYDAKLDRVGKIDIRDNVFIGHQALIMPGVVIGPNAIVAAGAVVTRDVPEDSVVGGVPAKKIGSMRETFERLRDATEKLPWAALIAAREGAFDPNIEPELQRLRVKHFFGEG